MEGIRGGTETEILILEGYQIRLPDVTVSTVSREREVGSTCCKNTRSVLFNVENDGAGVFQRSSLARINDPGRFVKWWSRSLAD